MIHFPLLTLSIFLPLIGALVTLLSCKNDDSDLKKIKITALSFSALTLLLSLYLYYNFLDIEYGQYRFEDKFSWFVDQKIFFHVGIDAISLPFILLTNFLTIIAILSGCNSIKDNLKYYMIAFLVLQTLILGAFSAVDIILFYVFFESVLIPMFFIIGIWGGDNRIYAAYKFFLYTLFGSIFLLISILYIYHISGVSDIPSLVKIIHNYGTPFQILIWLGFFISFAIKIPMWPLHTWLPDAHVEAPTGGSIILAGILLKMGGYGFIRLSLPMLPQASQYFLYFIAVISVIAIIYASFVAFAQTNMKKLIAYSSIAHMGYVTIAIFSGNIYGIQGAIFQMISHGLISAGLFFCVGILSDRGMTKEISGYGGVASVMPNFAILFAILTFASIALPGTSGFVGEFLSLLSIYEFNKTFCLIALFGIVVSAVYMLSLYKRIMFGKVRNNNLLDTNRLELMILISVVALILLLGIYPALINNLIGASSISIVKSLQFYK